MTKDPVMQRELKRLRRIEHAAWHVCESSAEDAQTGEFTVDREDFMRLSALLPEQHPPEHTNDHVKKWAKP